MLRLLACAFLLTTAAFAQSGSASDATDTPRPTHATVGLRSMLLVEAAPLRPLAAADSLPDGMPLNTRLLWGRRGALRVTGLGPETRRGELRLRRRALGWHQRLGLLTLGAMTTQVVLGELVAANPGRYYESLQPVHRTLGYATFGTYSATAAFAIAAPPGRRYGDGFSSIRLHRYLAVVHFAGMMAMPWMGRRIGQAQGFDDFQRRLDQHRWTGRVTFGAFALAVASTFLPW